MKMISSFRERLEEVMSENGITTTELAHRIGLSKQAISAYTTGVRHPKQPVIESICKVFNVSPAWLIGYDVDRNLPLNIMPLRKTKRAPLIGQIACGKPILAEENIEDYIPYPDFIDADFCLTCKGDSMINAGIHDEDIVFIKSQPDVDDGEIAAVQIGLCDYCEATLKRVYHGHNKITLVAENPKYDNLVYKNSDLNEMKIIGKAVWVLGRVR